MELKNQGAEPPRLSTLSVHAGEAPDPATGAVSIPIHQVAPFSAPTVDELARRAAGDSGWIYSRTSNPTVVALEEKVARLESTNGTGIESTAFASGMGAITATFLALAPPSGRILVAEEVYGGTDSLLSQVLTPLGFHVLRAESETGHLSDAIRRERPDVVYWETPTNPCLKVLDIGEIVLASRSVGAKTILDATFASPILTRPLEHGVDVAVHSATKSLGGHHDVTAGVVTASREIARLVKKRRELVGSCLDPHAAWLVLRGMKTLALRVRASSANALAIANFLEAHPRVRAVNYPGIPSHPNHAAAKRQMAGAFGGMLSFELAGGRPAVDRFVAALRWIRLIPSLGGVETGISIPYVTSHRSFSDERRAALGITEGLVRLSAGIEDEADLVADLAHALAG